MIKLNTTQQGEEAIRDITDRITNECIVSAKSDKSKKRLVRTIVAIGDIAEGVNKLRHMINEATSLSFTLSTNEKDNFARCAEHLLKAQEELT